MDRLEDARQVASRIEEWLDRDPHPPTEGDAQERWQATRAAGTRLKQMLERTPDEFIPPGWLDQIEAQFNPTAAEVESYASSEEPSEFPVQWERIQTLWNILAPFLAAIPPEDSVSEDAASFRRSAGQLTRHLKDEVDEVAGQIEPLRTRLEELEEQRQGALTHFNERLASLEAAIGEQTARLDEAIRVNQQQFSEAQERRNKEFSDMLEERRTAFEEDVKANAKTVADRLEEIEAEASGAQGRLKDLEEKATASYSAIGSASIAAHFQKDAKDEKKSADNWRLVAVGALVLVVAALIAELILVSKDDFSIETTLARLPIALALAGLAGYAGNESRRHRRNERWAREREVEVSTIDPYLVLVSDEAKRDQIKLGFARRIFLEERAADPEPDEDGSGAE